MTGVTKIKIMNTKNMQQVSHLLLVVDPGTSLIKVMASIAGKPIDTVRQLKFCLTVSMFKNQNYFVLIQILMLIHSGLKSAMSIQHFPCL